jgi:hypothetical protein
MYRNEDRTGALEEIKKADKQDGGQHIRDADGPGQNFPTTSRLSPGRAAPSRKKNNDSGNSEPGRFTQRTMEKSAQPSSLSGESEGGKTI